jgi:hypothetical protein
MTAQQERVARRKVNSGLFDMGHNVYHDGLPITEIDAALVEGGFAQTEPAIYCGRDGSCHQQVGARTWLSLSWHKMESGRFEVTAYVS